MPCVCYARAVLAEYAVEITVHVTGDKLYVLPQQHYPHWGALAEAQLRGSLSKGSHPLGRYSFVDHLNEMLDLLSRVELDLCHAAGIDPLIDNDLLTSSADYEPSYDTAFQRTTQVFRRRTTCR